MASRRLSSVMSSSLVKPTAFLVMSHLSLLSQHSKSCMVMSCPDSCTAPEYAFHLVTKYDQFSVVPPEVISGHLIGAGFAFTAPAQQKQTCKIMQDSCKIVQESCMQDLHGTCTRYVPFLARFLHYLARSCTYLARNGARFCKRCCKNNYLQVWSFLHIFLQDLARIVQDCARIMQEKGHITCTCQASLILA